MTDPIIFLSRNLKKIRQEKGLSLGNVEEMTDVSKAMLSQIERGISNPSISTLWKISTGLQVPLTTLLDDDSNTSEVIDIKDIIPILEDQGKMKLYDVFSFDPRAGFEYLYIIMEPGASSKSKAHKSGTEEYIIVTEGELTLAIGDLETKLLAPSAMKFVANKEHSYLNRGNKNLIFQNIIKYG